MKYFRVVSEGGSVSRKLFTLEDAKSEVMSSGAIMAVVTPRTHKVVFAK